MNITECSKQLQVLTKAHAHYNMSLDDYLRERKVLLDTLDLNINGIAAITSSTGQEMDTSELANEQLQDKTQPYFAGKVEQCISFIKGSEK